MSRIARTFALLLPAFVLAACTGSGDSTSDADATQPSAQHGWVVAVGDSYISGEGARWAGNTNAEPSLVDALGPRAYVGRGCHRARTSEVQVGGWQAANLACSGAVAADLGFAGDGSTGSAQAAALADFAKSHDVAVVVVSIGGNDFGFGNVVVQCAADFLTTVGQRRQQLCRDDPEVRRWFSVDHQAVVARRISTALRNVATAMDRAGSRPNEYELVVQTYPSPLPPGPRIRDAESILERGFIGGCPFYSADATWANQAVATINSTVRAGVVDAGLGDVRLLDLTDALVGHRLCERGVGLFDPEVFDTWRDEGVAAAVEWVNRVYTGAQPWQVQESLHPNYWGVLAARAELAELLSD